MVEMRFEQGHINQYVNGRVSVSNLQAFNVDKTHRTYQDDGGCGTFRPEEDLDDIISRRDRLFATAARITTMPHVECPWGNLATMARLCLVLHHCGEVCTQTETALNYVESMLWKQLVAAIGKEVGPSDFSEYMIFHMRRLFKPAYLPTAFSVPVRRSCKHTPDGTVSIEQVSSTMMQPIFTLDACSTTSHPMRFNLSASACVTFHGERHLHAYLRNEFSDEEGVSLTLMARARQFSSMVVLLGRVVSTHVFDPKAAMIVQNKEELSIPLMLTTIPTAKEFKDAIVSLSPEQQEFAKAYRSMQLESTLFALLVIPIKPQLEAVLNMPSDSLTKEIKLTQDLMQLFIKYQVPTDLLSYSPQRRSVETDSAAAAVSGVQAHVAAMMQMLDDAKQEELRERAQEEALQRMIREVEKQDCLLNIELDKVGELMDYTRPRAAVNKGGLGAIFKRSGTQNKHKSRQLLFARTEKDSETKDSRSSSRARLVEPSACDDGVDAGERFCDNEVGPESQQQSVPEKRQLQGNSSSRAASSLPTTIRNYTTVPAELDRRCENFDAEGSLRPTIINLGETWQRRSQKGLLAQPSAETLTSAEQKREKDAAFDLLDALTKSGSLPIQCASLHIVVAATHCFDKTVMEAVVQDNVNPIEKVERSALIMASTIFQKSVASLVCEAETERLGNSMQHLLEDTP